jgi:sialate O-acetylesterase
MVLGRCTDHRRLHRRLEPERTKTVAVRYGWADNPPNTLRNREGLPAAPFRTDDWPPVTASR